MANRKDGKPRSDIQDLTGKVFGDWVVIAYARPDYWSCQCQCGRVKEVRSYHLRRGGSTRCPQCARSVIGNTQKTAHSSFPSEYGCWRGLKKRCLLETDPDYPFYGGRGISICERWKDSFDNFIADMGPRPSKNHSVDRFPDQNGNYEPGNCRWATHEEQNRNRRNNRLITYNGKTKCIAEWAAELGIPEATLGYRIYAGWSDEDAITTPVRKRSVRL